MLFEFLSRNRVELIDRCRAKVATRPAPLATPVELEYGIPLFLEQLITTLRAEQRSDAPANTDASTVPADIGATAEKHGEELLWKGFTVDQVVHDYGDLCQAVTELAAVRKEPVTVEEFHTFNRCLDNAIADAVSGFGRRRDQMLSEKERRRMNERLGYLAHELRNHLNGALLAVQAIKSGSVGLAGPTAAVLDRSLLGLRNLIDRSLAEVRLAAGLKARKELVSIGDLVEVVQVSAAMEATARGMLFSISSPSDGVDIEGDRDMLSSAISNILQNAFKFSPPGSRVSLVVRIVEGRVLIEVEDECGGLPQGKIEALFAPFAQAHPDRSGVGLGLSISRRSVEANGGTVRVTNRTGKGCVFTIDLPQRVAAPRS